MARRESINGRKYTFFIDYDRNELKNHPEDWIEWFRQRVLFILIDPIEEILKEDNRKVFDNENFTIFIGVTTLICCGIEALGGFYKGKASGKNFRLFVKKYMNTDYSKEKRKLDALQDYFRCGLAHGFCIKQGGITWGDKYFVEDEKLGLLISIEVLFKDFKQTFMKYIEDLKIHTNKELINSFKRRFNYVFILGR